MTDRYYPALYTEPHITNVRRFKDLILHRVREVLLVSSPYDAFILEEDGPITEQLFVEYQELSLSAAPRFTNASTAEVALKLLQERHFDLVLIMKGLGEMDVNAFGRKVKEMCPGRPVILLNLDSLDRMQLKGKVDPEAVDRVFVWTGDTKVLLAIIKFVEDRLNVDHDVKVGNVRVIIMIEDSARQYSSFLRVLYRELMSLSRSLYSEGQNQLFRLMYMRSRPKILHATSFEEAADLFLRYRRNVLAVISDVGIPRQKRLDPEAGLDFARFVRKYDPGLPILLQSSESRTNLEKAQKLKTAFLDKNSPSHLADVKSFLEEQLGFGDFVFRIPDGTEVDRARDLREFEEKLQTIPRESLVYHATHNHISLWLMARSEFELAEDLRPIKISDFKHPEECRRHVIQCLQRRRERNRLGTISDFDPYDDQQVTFARVGEGYLGGKARGIAFLNLLLSRAKHLSSSELPVRLPQTIVITTDEFDNFLVNNELSEFAYSCENDSEISSRFLAANLTDRLRQDLRFMVENISEPLAVRSSSLLEDSLHQPFAGVYATIMLPNDDEDTDVRHQDLCNAVKAVYASTFLHNARSYLQSTGNRIEEEKMGVIIQKLVGQKYDDRFYPTFSGVAQSHNYYPIGPQRPEDGVAHVGLGLGRIVVDGGFCLRFSPRHPQVLPQLANIKGFLDHSQRGFWAVAMDRRVEPTREGLESTLVFSDLRDAEKDGTLQPVGSVYHQADQRITEDFSLPGPRLVTFGNILKHRAIPLAETLQDLLKIVEEALGCAVEIEFACDMGDWGRVGRPSRERKEPRLYLLQVRPFATRSSWSELSKLEIPRSDILINAHVSLGHGMDHQIRDIIYVRREGWDASQNAAIARAIGTLNDQLLKEGRTFLLVGPGRWGTADPWLGIPVQWGQISNARVIVEASPRGYNVDPSHGTHFFHNITSMGIGYLTLPPGANKSDDGREEFVDWSWLDGQPATDETDQIRHVRLEAPLAVLLDGRKGRAVIGKPGSWQPNDQAG